MIIEEDIEIVARALSRLILDDEDNCDLEYEDVDQERFRSYARIVLEVMKK